MRTDRQTFAWMLIGLGAVGLALWLSLGQAEPTQRLQNLVFDLFQRAGPRSYDASVPVRVVDIDESSLREFGQWPWPRDRLAALTRRLAAFGARGVAFDILFAEADRSSVDEIVKSIPDKGQKQALFLAFQSQIPSNDADFAASLAVFPSVLGQTLTNRREDGEATTKAIPAYAGDNPAIYALPFAAGLNPIDRLAQSAVGLGAINLREEADTIVRRVPLLFAQASREPRLVPSLDLELLRVAQVAGTVLVKSSNASGARAFGAHSGIIAIKCGDLIIPTDSSGAVRVHYAGFQPQRRISAAAFLRDDSLAEQVRDKIILVGASAAGLNDIRATPLSGIVPGIDIHAELLENVLGGMSLLRPDDAPAWEGLAGLVFVALNMLLAMKLRPVFGVFIAAGLFLSTYFASFWAFSHFSLLIDALVPSFAGALAFAATGLLRYWQVDRQKRWVSLAFSRYVSPEIVEQLAADPSKLSLGGQTRELTIMFCDIRGFTARAQGMDAQAVVRFLNSIHSPLTEIILKSGGTVDKYLGDGLMAFWNAPHNVPDHAQRAVKAAIEMQKAATRINNALQSHSGETQPLRLGIGINTGMAFVGNMGSEYRFDYSIVGDAVNIAARLEALTKEQAVNIVISASTVAQCHGFAFVELGGLNLKGRIGETQGFTLGAE